MAGEKLTKAAKPAMVFSLAEILGEEMEARGWTIEDAASRMAVAGPARDALTLAIAMAVQNDQLVLECEFFDGLSRAFDVSPEFFRRIHQVWIDHPAARQTYSAPDNLFGPWLRTTLATTQGRETGGGVDG